MEQKHKYYIVEASALPEVFLKVAEAKELLETGQVKTVNEAAQKTGISRSAFYKYRDTVMPFHNMMHGRVITFQMLMRDQPGCLSDVLNIFAEQNANRAEESRLHIENTLGISPILITAKDEASREALVSRIEDTFESGDFSAADNAVITNARQFASVSEALEHAENALYTLDMLGADTACTELELAMGKLGELDGRQVTTDVVDSIFHRFCVGK